MNALSSHSRKFSIGAINASYEVYVKPLVDECLKDNVITSVKVMLGHSLDLIQQLQGKLNSDRLLLCNDMLRSQQDMFLDDKTPADVESALGVKTEFYPNDGYRLAQQLLGTEF